MSGCSSRLPLTAAELAAPAQAGMRKPMVNASAVGGVYDNGEFGVERIRVFVRASLCVRVAAKTAGKAHTS